LQKIIKNIEKTIWIFPDSHKYPFLRDFIKSKVRVLSGKKYVRIYNAVAKFFPYMTVSTDDLKLLDDFLFCTSWRMPNDLLDFAERHPEPLSSRYRPLINREQIVLYGVRDGYWSRENNDLSQSEEHHREIGIRNSSLENHLCAMESLCDRGFQVIRIGRSPINANLYHRNFSDYATDPESNSKTDFLLWSKAKFAISTGFGADEISIIFNTPVLYLDFASGINFELRHAYDSLRAYLPKVFIWEKTSDKLTLEELEGIGYFEKGRDFNLRTLSDLGVIPIGNTSDLLIQVVNDYASLILEQEESQFIFAHGKRISRRWQNLWK
jgi:putative glycosyltransferase (TIGR04372 family)